MNHRKLVEQRNEFEHVDRKAKVANKELSWGIEHGHAKSDKEEEQALIALAGK